MSCENFTAEEVEAMPDRIAETFAGQKLLVTGGTGFLGKVLLEKLLRKCPDVGQIYLLVRSKKGKNPRERLEEIFNGELFEKLRDMKGGIEPLLEKVSIIGGDVSMPDLGISNEDRQKIIDDINIIIHVAATIRFDEEMKKAVLLNVRGTKLMLELAKQCKNLKLFVHISTAYCHLHEKLLEEKAYPPPADPYQIIQAMEWMDDESIAALTPKLLNKLPNSYAFTKSLSEALVVEAMEHIPAVILRPSIVVPIWQDPVPGWTDNMNGPVGLLIGGGKGVVRTMFCKSNGYADFVPVDILINGTMIAVWNYLVQGETTANIINITTSAEIKVTWQEIIDTGLDTIKTRVPFNGVVWYPGASMTTSRLYHNICVIFLHWLPAVLIDTLLFCLGHKPVLIRVQRRISKGIEVLKYYTSNQWDFKSDGFQSLRQHLNARERQDYKVDSIGLNISNYFEDCMRSARKFILKEYDDTLPAARRHMRVMFWVDVIAQMLFWFLIIYWMSGLVFGIGSYLFESSSDVTPIVMAA